MAIFDKIGGALGGASSTVLTRYKADVSEHKRAIKDLQKTQKRQAQETIRHLEAQNAKVDKSIARWGKLAAGVAAVGGAYYGAQKALDAYVKDAQMKHASMGISIKGLQAASHGLLTEMQAMQLAAAGLNTEWGISQKQAEGVAEWIANLYHQGNDLNQVFETMKKSIAEGGVEELQKFGIQLRNVKGQLETKGEAGFNALMAEAANQVGTFADVAGDDAVRASNQLKDATRNLGVQFGELARNVLPAVSNALSAVVGNVNELWGAIANPSGLKGLAKLEQAARHRFGVASLVSRLPDWAISEEMRADVGGYADRQHARFMELQVEMRRKQRTLQPAYIEGRKWVPFGWGGPGTGTGWGPAAGDTGTGGGGTGGGGTRPLVLEPAYGANIPASASGRFGGYEGMGVPPAKAFGGQVLQPSFVAGGGEGLYGGTTDMMQPGFSAQALDEAKARAVEAAAIFRDAGTQAFSAWIKGSASMAQAFKQAVGDMIASKAANLFATGLEAGVMALYHLARGDPRAAIYGKAAALALSQAAVLGGIAKAMGAGKVPGTSGAARVSGAGGGIMGGGGDGDRTRVIVLSGDYADDRYEAAARARRAMEWADREEGRNSSVEYM
jgi:hypothetical protein